MKYVKCQSEAEANTVRDLLNEKLGFDDKKGTERATDPADLGEDGYYYVTILDQWLPKLPEGATVVDDFERIVSDDDET